MSNAKEFQLLGHGNGWPGRGFIINRGPVPVDGANFYPLPTAITSNSLNMGDAISVRPYIEPDFSTSFGPIAFGFLRFRTLGGYSDSSSGPPTREQLNLSLKNAMNFFYNAERGGSASASSFVSASEDSNLSSSISPSELLNQTGGNPNPGSFPFTGEALSPRERVVSFIRERDKNNNRLHDVQSNRLFGDQDHKSFSIPETSIGISATSGRYQVTIVRLFDTTDTNNPMFLGYGLQSHTVAIGGGGKFAFGGAAQSSIGSYFNPSVDFFNPDPDNRSEVKFDISNTDVDDMPLLVFNQASTFDGNRGADTSSSVTSSSATFSLFSGEISGSSSISPSYEFYTY